MCVIVTCCGVFVVFVLPIRRLTVSHRFGVGTQLVLSFILVSVISVSSLLFVTTRLASRATTDDALALLDETAKNYSGELSSFFENGLLVAMDISTFFGLLLDRKKT